MSRKKRTNIGLLVSGISDSFTIQLCRGIIRHAAELGINIFILPGKYINRDVTGQPELIYEYQYATVFSFVKKENLDGLIIAAGCIGCLTTKDNLMKLLRTFDGIPNVLVASHYEGYSCVCYDNKNAVVEGIEHLITRAGCKHICILDGKPGNSDAIERRQAYLDTLEKHGLKFEERMSARGDLSYDDDTREGMRTLLKNNPEIDAVFCVNDESAMAAYDVLKEQGLKPGKDILVMGYDNIHESTTLDPPLSTVSVDPVRLGRESLDAVLRKMQGEEVGDVIMPSRFILRESFGSFVDIAELTEDTEKDYYESSFEAVFFHYINSFGRDKAEDAYVKYIRLMRAIYDPLKKNIPNEEILERLDDLFKTEAVSYMDTDEFLLNTDRQSAIVAEKTECYGEVQRIMVRFYRRLSALMDRRMNNVSQKQYQFDFSMKNFVKETLSFRHGTDQGYQAFIGYLDWLDVDDAFLYVMDEPITHLDGEPFVTPQYFNLKATRKNDYVGVVHVKNQRKSINELFSNEELGDAQRSMLLLPLFFEEKIYGLLLVDMTEPLYREGEFVVNQLGIAAHFLHIMQENDETRQQLEEHITVLRQHNIELDTLSRVDILTGLFNRRGFEMDGEVYLEEAAKDGAGCLVGYVDMNDLKIVNDRFGHDDGDFALKKIAEVIKQNLPENAVSGRIGGDEYAFIVRGEESDGAMYETRMRECLNSFNKSSDKPYNVSMSVGAIFVPADKKISLTEALAAADEKLYVAKRNKDRKIVK